MSKLTFGSLFAGVGGFDLGFERAGMVCKWQVEIDPYATRVLEKHWPDVRRHDDVRTFPPEGDWSVDVICGGFPCQDISSANPNRTGLKGKRSGLWSEFHRVLRLLRPRFAVIENVANVTFLGLDQVLSDLAEIGFDAEWATVPASLFGAPHRRRRCFIVAHTMRERCEVVLRRDAGTFSEAPAWRERAAHSFDSLGDLLEAIEKSVGEPSVLGSGDGVSNRMGRLAGTGNAVCPPVAEWIGRRLMEAS